MTTNITITVDRPVVAVLSDNGSPVIVRPEDCPREFSIHAQNSFAVGEYNEGSPFGNEEDDLTGDDDV